MLLNQQLVQQFVSQAVMYGDYEVEDAIYIQNQLIRILNASGIDNTSIATLNESATANEITQYWIQNAVDQNCIEDVLYLSLIHI